MPDTLTALADELATDPLGRGYAAMEDAAAAADLNAPTRPGRRIVPAGDVKSYLFVHDLLFVLEVAASASPPNLNAAAVVKSVTMFSEFDCRKPEVYAKIDAILTALVADGLIAETHRAAILAMADTAISRAQELGLGAVDHLAVARVRGRNA